VCFGNSGIAQPENGFKKSVHKTTNFILPVAVRFHDIGGKCIGEEMFENFRFICWFKQNLELEGVIVVPLHHWTQLEVDA
jgi:hypothetical protein